MIWKLAAAVCGSSVLFTSAALANVQNGSFETGNLTNWTVSGAVTVFGQPTLVSFGASGSFSSGLFVASFGSSNFPATGIIEQFIPTSAGISYTVEFDYGKFATASGAQQIRLIVSDSVSLTNILDTTVIDNTGTTNLGNVLSHYNFGFTATGSGVIVSFRDASTATFNTDGLLDNVTVSAVPEFPTAALMLTGFALLSTYRRRQTALDL